MNSDPPDIEEFDVIVVGAGISGISAAYHLQTRCPDRSYTLLEGRASLGGTWDLFQYPGVRSDSDMHTLGFGFHPWSGDHAIADGESILAYLNEAAVTYGIDRHIRTDHRVVSAEWSSSDANWTVTVERGATRVRQTMRCNFLHVCSGYYDYDRGYSPDFEDAKRFSGPIVHPQFWPDDVDWHGKRVVVIGSGATAVTLVPELAKRAGHVTMLQRSPTYIVARPSEDRIANWLRRRLPLRMAYGIVRWKNVGLQYFFYRLARQRPHQVKARLVQMVRDRLGPEQDVETHFTPRYNPWDQRLCLVPDGDLFESIKAKRVSVETDQVERFTETGILLKSGKVLDADIIVTATGLELKLLGDIALRVDGIPVDPAKALNYKGMMYSDIPNLASTFGYTNASWTLRADLTAGYVCRLLNTMRSRGMRQCTPRMTGPVAQVPFLDFTSGYVQRAIDRFPRQGKTRPWRMAQSYPYDIWNLRFGSVDDHMAFSNPASDRCADTPRGARPA